MACRTTIKQGRALGTHANHRVHKKADYRFCDKYQYIPFPAEEWRYVQFAQFLADEGKTPDTVNNYVGTIRVMHRMAGLQAPEPSQIHFPWHADGLKRGDTRVVRQAGPMTHEILRKLQSAVDFTKELHVVAYVAMLVAFAMVLRVSNIGPATRKLFDSVSHPT